jgi:hypothetical protein
MNFIAGMLPKWWVECSSSSHINTSSTSIWANGSLDLYPTPRHPGMRTCCILYLILNKYYQKLSLIPWSIKSICSITLHRPLWEHLVNRRVGRETHLPKGSLMTLRTVVNITWITPRLREMRKSWYEFSFMSCMCMSLKQSGRLLLDDVVDLSYVSKICVNVYWQCGWLYSHIWCMFVDSHIWCMSFVDSHIWCILFVDSHVDDIVYVVINILYVISIWFFVLSHVEENILDVTFGSW